MVKKCRFVHYHLPAPKVEQVNGAGFFYMAKIRWYTKFESFQKVGRLEKTLAKTAKISCLYIATLWTGLLKEEGRLPLLQRHDVCKY